MEEIFFFFFLTKHLVGLAYLQIGIRCTYKEDVSENAKTELEMSRGCCILCLHEN